MAIALTAILVSTSAVGFGGLIHQGAGAINPLAVVGFVLDTEDNPVDGAAVTITIHNTGGIRATRNFTTLPTGAYQTLPDFDPAEWDIGDRVEVVAVYGPDYGSNFTVLDSLNTEFLTTWVNITYPFKLIGPNTPPVPIFNLTPTTGTQRTVFKFDATSSYDNETNSTEIQVRWDFDGDGIWEVNWTVVKTAEWNYSAPGNFTARLEVRDGAGATNSTTRSVEVISSAPIAAFTSTINYLVLSVNASASSDPEGVIVSYDWDFGDGGHATGVTATHAYATSGTYTVNLTVTNDIGLTDTDGRSVTANASVVFNLALVRGWNFVTIPLVGGPYKASNIGLLRLDVVATYNPTTRIYDGTYIVGVSPLALDITFQPSTGYWISATAWENISITGTAPAVTQSRSVTLPVGGGWVNLGLMTLNTTWKASKIPTMFSGGSVTTVARYNPVTRTYQTYISGVPPSDFTLIPGQGLWCYCTASGTFTYDP